MTDLKNELEDAMMSCPPPPQPPDPQEYTPRKLEMVILNCRECPFKDGEFWKCRKTGEEFYGINTYKGVLASCPLPKVRKENG